MSTHLHVYISDYVLPPPNRISDFKLVFGNLTQRWEIAAFPLIKVKFIQVFPFREFSLLAGVEAQQLEENIFNDCACPADYPKPHPQSPHVCVPRDYVIGSDITSVQSRYSGNDLHIPQMMLDFDRLTFWVSGLETPVTVEVQLPASHMVQWDRC